MLRRINRRLPVTAGAAILLTLSAAWFVSGNPRQRHALVCLPRGMADARCRDVAAAERPVSEDCLSYGRGGRICPVARKTADP